MIKIDNNLLSVFNSMVKNRDTWKYVTDDQKNEFFFIINRLMSKKFPDKSKLLNKKNIDKSTSLNLWYYYMLDKPYPKWIWSKSELNKDKKISDKDYNLLLRRLDIKNIDLDYLIDNHIDFIKDELK